MEFGPINLAGAILVAAMLAPNILYAVRFRREENRCANPAANILEQVGRYGAMALMVFPLGVWKFGFPSVAGMLVYVFGNVGLLLAYWAVWGTYFRKPTRNRAFALAVLPTCIFLLSGLTLRHWLLVLAAVLFGGAHLYVTSENHK